MTDAEKLTMLADWFDDQDDQHGYTGPRDVQAVLRRIADALSARTPPPGHVLCDPAQAPTIVPGASESGCSPSTFEPHGPRQMRAQHTFGAPE